MSAKRSAQNDQIVAGRRGGSADRVFEGVNRKAVGIDFDDVQIGPRRGERELFVVGADILIVGCRHRQKEPVFKRFEPKPLIFQRALSAALRFRTLLPSHKPIDPGKHLFHYGLSPPVPPARRQGKTNQFELSAETLFRQNCLVYSIYIFYIRFQNLCPDTIPPYLTF